MPRIRLLSEAVVNRIAAGEVIERPAAAARELVENALDAGATRIRVVIEGGGVTRIEITDDGFGMTEDELALAVQRHATSKLTDDTLVRISTLGFRGEALPSIGAAARLQITSRTATADSAHSISVEGGAVGGVTPAAGPLGTRVVVRDLFFATPARRKFLKSPRAEADAVQATITRLALAAPHVAFGFENDGRTAFDLPAQDRAARIASLLGPDTTLPVSGQRGELHIEGFIAPPSVTRATANAQALVVNGRPVTDPVLRTAIRVAYRDVIAAGRFAVVALYLTIPPEDVDVNVHPAKAELRYRDADAVRALVIGAVGRALAGGAGGASPSGVMQFQSRPNSGRPGLYLPPQTPGNSPFANFSGFAEASLPMGLPPTARPAQDPPPPELDHPLGAAVAQVLDTYIIAVAGDGSLVLVDQHAAHERLTHEAIRNQMLEGGVRTQPLLLPAVVDMPSADAARLMFHATDLADLGLDIEAFGHGAILVRAMPAALGNPDPAPLLRDVADELAEQDESTALESRLDAVIARLACHGSIRAGRRLAGPEMDALLRQMESTPRAATCSHGRPTFLKLTRSEIERMFGRR
jgi:DNA mismatch repair protein MutL